MILDITKLDNIQVLQAIYAYNHKKSFKLKDQESQDAFGIDEEEAKRILDSNSSNGVHEICNINEVPIKWLGKVINKRYLLFINRFDYEFGESIVLEILCENFGLESFSILSKNYGKSLRRPSLYQKSIENSSMIHEKYQKLLKEAILVEHSYGERWHFIP